MKWIANKILDFRFWLFEFRIDFANVKAIQAMKANSHHQLRRDGLISRRNNLRKASGRFYFRLDDFQEG